MRLSRIQKMIGIELGRCKYQAAARQHESAQPANVVTQDASGFAVATSRALEARDCIKREEQRIRKLESELAKNTIDADRHQQRIIDRLQRRLGGEQRWPTDDVHPSEVSIKVSELEAMGIRGASDASHRFEYVALKFSIESILKRVS